MRCFDRAVSRRCIPVAVLMVASVALMCGCSTKEPAKPPLAATEVVAVTVEPKTVPATFPFVAQIQSSHQVDVMSPVSGFLEKISYKEGDAVRKGQVLFQIDRKPFQAQVNSVKGELESRKAQLWTAKASLDRIRPLADQNAASKSDLDTAIGNFKSAEAGLQQAKANLEKAQLDLNYTTIRSAVNGVAGQSLMRQGAYIAAGSSSAKLTYVAKLDPAWVDFSVSQNDQDRLHQEVQKGQLLPPKDSRFTVELELANGVRYPTTGVVNFADPSFSKETGTFLVRAVISNPKGELRPGMYVKAHLKGAQRPNALVVPQKAVQQSPNGHVVFLVDNKGLAEVRPVTVGDWLGNDWIISQGLKPGDRIIVEGFMKLAPGMPVKVVPSGQVKQAQPQQPAAAK